MLLEVSCGLLAQGMAALLPEVDELVESNQTSLLLLSQEIGRSGATRALRANQDYVQLLLLFESGRHLDLKLIREHLSELSLKISLKVGKSVASLRYLLLGLLGLGKLGPGLTILVRRVLLSVLFCTRILGDLLLVDIVLLHTLLCLFDLTLEALDLTLVIVLLFDGGPELGARPTQRQEQWLTRSAGLEVFNALQDFFLVDVLPVEVKRIDLDGLVHRVSDLKFLDC